MIWLKSETLHLPRHLSLCQKRLGNSFNGKNLYSSISKIGMRTSTGRMTRTKQSWVFATASQESWQRRLFSSWCRLSSDKWHQGDAFQLWYCEKKKMHTVKIIISQKSSLSTLGLQFSERKCSMPPPLWQSPPSSSTEAPPSSAARLSAKSHNPN